MEHTDSPFDNNTPETHYHDMMTSFAYGMTFAELIVLFPAVIIMNLILFIAIVKSEKIRSDPWRWLIAHTAIVVVLKTILLAIEGILVLGLKPSQLPARVILPLLLIKDAIGIMTIASAALVVTERFHAMRFGKEEEGGMGKKAVIRSILLFWLLAVIPFVIIDLFIEGISPVIKFVILLWAFVTMVTIIVWTTVIICRKTISAGKDSVAAPILSLAILLLIFAIVPDALHTAFSPSVADMDLRFFGGLNAAELCATIGWIAFPIIWLVTWLRNGDISSNKSNSEMP